MLSATELTKLFNTTPRSLMVTLATYIPCIPEGPGLEVYVDLMKEIVEGLRQKHLSDDRLDRSNTFRDKLRTELETGYNAMLDRDQDGGVGLSDAHFDWLVDLGCYSMMEDKYRESVAKRFNQSRAWRFCGQANLTSHYFCRFFPLIHQHLDDEQFVTVMDQWLHDNNWTFFEYGTKDSLRTGHDLYNMVGKLSIDGRDFGERIFRIMWTKGGLGYRRAIARNPHIPQDIMTNYVMAFRANKNDPSSSDWEERDAEVYDDFMKNPSLSQDVMIAMASDQQEWHHLARNPSVPPLIIDTIRRSPDTDARITLMKNPTFQAHPGFEKCMEDCIDGPESWLVFNSIDDEAFIQQVLCGNKLGTRVLLKLLRLDCVESMKVKRNRIVNRLPWYVLAAEDEETILAIINQVMLRTFGHEGMQMILSVCKNLSEKVIRHVYSKVSGGGDGPRGVRFAIAKHPNTPVFILNELKKKYGKTTNIATLVDDNLANRGLAKV